MTTQPENISENLPASTFRRTFDPFTEFDEAVKWVNDYLNTTCSDPFTPEEIKAHSGQRIAEVKIKKEG
jgi:hypothetical protein